MSQATQTARTIRRPGARGILSRRVDPGSHGSSYRTEFLADLTNFVILAYIIFVNTSIMTAAGM